LYVEVMQCRVRTCRWTDDDEQFLMLRLDHARSGGDC
jgi:hypothetical protein